MKFCPAKCRWTVVTISLGLQVAIAQEESQPAEDVIEEVVVTGSRLITSKLDSPSPVLVIDGSDLRESGITTLGEFSRYLPQNALVGSDAGSFNSSARGSSSFNLRGVGTDATLTLLNGRRVAPYGSQADSSPFVDINAIPVVAIERIEVLKDGASAIYGSEAVAGVVNIITRRDFDYLEVQGGYLSTTEGDGEEWDVNITGLWSGESTRITATFSYLDRAIVWGRDRKFSRDADLRRFGGRNARSPYSSPPSAFLLDSEQFARDPACPEQTDLNSHDSTGPQCLFNMAHFHSLQQPTERVGLLATLDHDFDGGKSGFLEVLANSRETSSWLAPAPVFPPVFVPEFHPNNPFGEDLVAFYRVLDTPSRKITTDSDAWRLVAGLRGAWAGTWKWEAALTWGENDTRETLATGILADEFRAALQGFGGPDGNQFYNPFGLNPQNSPEVLEGFLAYNVSEWESSKEGSAQFQVTGDLLEMDGGNLGVAMGAEFRRHDLDQNADDLALRGELLGSLGLAPLNLDRDVFAAFVEFLVPLHERFEAQLALRYDDYSDFGSTTNPKIGLGWRPATGLLVRATWGTSFRPPTFRQLFDPTTQYIDFSSSDPHRCPVTDALFDCDGHIVEFEFRGNPDLEPDEGETWGLGLAWEPDSVPGLSVALDWWAVEHSNRITESGDYLTEALDPASNPFVIRDAPSAEDIALGIPGPIIKYADTYINGDTLETRGVDLDLSYTRDSENAGLWHIGVNYSYLDRYELGFDFGPIRFDEDFAGTNFGIDGMPQDRATFRLGWERDSHGVSAVVSYAGKYRSPRNVVEDGIPTDEPYDVPSFTQLDLSWRYRFERWQQSELQLGCNNCTDKYPFYNWKFVPEAFHESRGAMYYVRWAQKFGL